MVIDIGTKDSALSLSEADILIDHTTNELNFSILIDEHTSLLEADGGKNFKEKAKMFLAKMKEKIIQICNTVVNAIRKAYATILYKSAENQKKKIDYARISDEVINKTINEVLSNNIYYSYDKIRNSKDYSKGSIPVEDYLNIARLSDEEKKKAVSKDRFTRGNDIGQLMRDNITLCNKLRDENLEYLKKYSSSVTSEEYMTTAKNMFNQYSACMKAIINNAKVDIEIIKELQSESKEIGNNPEFVKLSFSDIKEWFNKNGLSKSTTGYIIYPPFCKSVFAKKFNGDINDKENIIVAIDKGGIPTKVKKININKLDDRLIQYLTDFNGIYVVHK